MLVLHACTRQIGVLAFADNVEFPADPCYSQGLSLATATNKEKLKKEFIASIQGTIKSDANYSNAFSEAFRLLADVDADNASESTNNQRGSLYLLRIRISRCDFRDLCVMRNFFNGLLSRRGKQQWRSGGLRRLLNAVDQGTPRSDRSLFYFQNVIKSSRNLHVGIGT